MTAVAALAAPAAATAHPDHFRHVGDRGEQATYPYASRLCERVAAGHVPRQLAGDTGQLTAACAQLSTSFTGA